MKKSNQDKNKNKRVKEQLVSFDTLRILLLMKWYPEIIYCLLNEPLYFTDISLNVKMNEELKNGNNKEVKLMTNRILMACLICLENNFIIERVVINPKRITKGYALTKHGMDLVAILLPIIEFLIEHDKKMRGKL